MARFLPNSFALAGVLLALFSPRLVTAQQIAVKLVDGRNGRALKDQAVAIWLGEKAVGMPGQTIRANADGIALVPIPIQQSSFVIGGESLVDCRMRVRYGKVVDEGTTNWVYRFADVLAHGAVGAQQMRKSDSTAYPRSTRAVCTAPALVGKSDVGIVGVTAQHEKPLDFSGCNSRPETGALRHPVADAAISSLDLLKRGVLSFHNASTSGQNVKSADSVNHEHE
jgi:hypothetical protein